MKKQMILIGTLLCGLALGTAAQPGVHARQMHRTHIIKKQLDHERMSPMQKRNLKRQQRCIHRQGKHIKSEGVTTPKERMRMRAHRQSDMRHDMRRRHLQRHRN